MVRKVYNYRVVVKLQLILMQLSIRHWPACHHGQQAFALGDEMVQTRTGRRSWCTSVAGQKQKAACRRVSSSLGGTRTPTKTMQPCASCLEEAVSHGRLRHTARMAKTRLLFWCMFGRLPGVGTRGKAKDSWQPLAYHNLCILHMVHHPRPAQMAHIDWRQLTFSVRTLAEPCEPD